MSARRTLWMGSALLIVAVAALASNVFLLARLTALQRSVGAMEGEVAAAMEAAETATRQAGEVQRQLDTSYRTAGLLLDFVGEQLALIETQQLTVTVPISERVPIRTTLPFEETFSVPVNSRVPIDTTVRVPLNLGLLGAFDLDIPIRTEVPISLTVEVPLRKQIPIETTVPIRLEVPVALSLADTSLAGQLAAWRAGLDQLRQAFPATRPPTN